MSDDCSINLNCLTSNTSILTLSCYHRHHLQRLALSLQTRNIECPLRRIAINATVCQ